MWTQSTATRRRAQWLSQEMLAIQDTTAVPLDVASTGCDTDRGQQLLVGKKEDAMGREWETVGLERNPIW